jgi:diaminopimelate epimerase
MKIEFTKMQGAGNDFVVIDAVRKEVKLAPEHIEALADRHRGIGCDQVLIIEPPKHPEVDFEYKIFNADGSIAGQCGNGARCVGRFIHEQKLSAKQEIMLQVGEEFRRLRIGAKLDVKAELGPPKLNLKDVPCTLSSAGPEHELSLANTTLKAGIISMGNPHAVILVDDCQATPVGKIGPMIQKLDVFPSGVNVGFMEFVDATHISLRVFERGAGETMACGSGACAAVVHGIRLGLLSPEVTVNLPGGKLEVSWAGNSEPVWLAGPAETVFQGSMNLG